MSDIETDEDDIENITPKNRPDFVLVVDNASATRENTDKIIRFLEELRTIGIQHDSEEFSANKNLGFIKLHGPDRVLHKSAEMYNIELACFSPELKPPSERPAWKFMKNELNAPEDGGVVYQRAPHLLTVNRPNAITSAERILVLYTILNNARFGKEEHDVGFEKLLETKVFQDGFPLHDGTHHWSDRAGPANERQLLNKYWSRLGCLPKAQPLDVIHHYFGTSTGFYFAWLGYYNQMLLPMAIAGLVFFVLGLAVFNEEHKHVADEVCNSHIKICPRCLTRYCSYHEINSSCFQAKYSYAFDNPMTFAFAILMSIWAVFFLRAWKRKERILQMRWNVKHLEVDSSPRYSFKENAKLTRKSPITGEEVPFVPKNQKVACYVLSLLILAIMISILAFTIVILMLWSHYISTAIAKHTKWEFLGRHADIFSSSMVAALTICFVLAFSKVYRTTALQLTNLENPRTQIDFENSYVYKIYILAFVNNYTSMFYVAFFKGKFYTHPGDIRNYRRYFGVGADHCDTFGCIWSLGILMMANMFFKKTALIHGINWMNTNVIQKIVARCRISRGVLAIFKPVKYDKKKQWEREYLLRQDSNLEVLDEYLSMAIQYGFVTFFVACFPLAPLLAWINNVFEVRMDARKRTVEKRRIVPLRVMGLGAWHHVFQAATMISFISNALVIAFTSDFISKEIYKNRMNTLQGYVNFSLSVFDTNDFFNVDFDYRAETFCFYPGHRYDPVHPERYEKTPFCSYLFTMKLIFIVVFVHALFLLSGLVSFIFPTTPFAVKQLINMQEESLKDLKMNPNKR